MRFELWINLKTIGTKKLTVMTLTELSQKLGAVIDNSTFTELVSLHKLLSLFFKEKTELEIFILNSLANAGTFDLWEKVCNDYPFLKNFALQLMKIIANTENQQLLLNKYLDEDEL